LARVLILIRVVSNPVVVLYYALERTDSLNEGFKTHDRDSGNSVCPPQERRDGDHRVYVNAD